MSAGSLKEIRFLLVFSLSLSLSLSSSFSTYASSPYSYTVPLPSFLKCGKDILVKIARMDKRILAQFR
jgi:hypothetical protein